MATADSATAMAPLSNSDSEVTTLPFDSEKQGRCKGCVKSPRNRVMIIVGVTAVLAIVVGFLIGYFVPKGKVCRSSREDMHDKFEDKISAAELEQEFR